MFTICPGWDLTKICTSHSVVCDRSHTLFCVYTGHLHAGNVTVTGDTCQLMEVQNWAFGLPPYYKTFLVHHKKVQVSEQNE